MLCEMFERFTERARQVVVLSQEEARTLRHDYIGTEHILLGLLRERDGIAAQALGRVGITLEPVRARVVRIVGSGDEPVTRGQVPFTPRAKKVLELALREAVGLGHDYIGTEHILLGLLREQEGIGAEILMGLDADPKRLREIVLELIGQTPPELRAGAQRPHRPGRTLRGGSIHVEVGMDVQRLLMSAAARSLDERREQIELEDLLIALTQLPSTAPLLEALGVDEPTMRSALERQDGKHESDRKEA
jgi:ATP-dependent Clp protease ATP-binding subunit ClpA